MFAPRSTLPPKKWVRHDFPWICDVGANARVVLKKFHPGWCSAYLQARFGNPLRSTSEHGICEYFLTTPRKDVLIIAHPHLSGPWASFGICLPLELEEELLCEELSRRDRKAGRSFDIKSLKKRLKKKNYPRRWLRLPATSKVRQVNEAICESLQGLLVPETIGCRLLSTAGIKIKKEA